MKCRRCKYFENCGDLKRTEHCDGYKEENKYPEHIMKVLRQRLGLDEDDTLRDDEINIYSPSEAFEEVLNWEGILGYANTIKWWIESIYGIDIDALAEEMSETETEDDEDDYCIGVKPDLSFLSNNILPRFKETGDL